MACRHAKVENVNWYELGPKYRCLGCSQILICQCEKALSARMLPHQTREAGGPGFWRVPVDGFAEAICHHCRGVRLPSAPMAKSRSRKGKVERYYWREINRTKFEMLGQWLDDKGMELGLLELQASHRDVVDWASKSSLTVWKDLHRQNPRYETTTTNQQDFLAEVDVPVTEFRARYTKVEAANGHPLGRFFRDGMGVTVEEWVGAEA